MILSLLVTLSYCMRRIWTVWCVLHTGKNLYGDMEILLLICRLVSCSSWRPNVSNIRNQARHFILRFAWCTNGTCFPVLEYVLPSLIVPVLQLVFKTMLRLSNLLLISWVSNFWKITSCRLLLRYFESLWYIINLLWWTWIQECP